jgi:hypothetical protein
MVTTADLAAYLRAANSGLQPYLDAARSKARAAGIPDYQNNAQYDLFILALSAMYYDNRGMGTPLADPAKAQRMIDSFVLELRHAGEDPAEEAGAE